MQKVPFLGKRILVLTAHPDDEGIAAGTMYANYRAGGETFLICATSGEKGKSHLKRHVTDAALKRIRRDELLRAARVLHIKKVFFLGLPDAGLRENAKKLFAKSSAVVKRVKPEQMLSFGPDGMSGHWDHITVGKVALRIARRLKIPLAAATVSPAFTIMTSSVSATALVSISASYNGVTVPATLTVGPLTASVVTLTSSSVSFSSRRFGTTSPTRR